MIQQDVKGHLTAILTITIWGVTFVSTKTLLKSFTPFEILIIRFTMGFIALNVILPKRFKITSFQEELLYVLGGLSGIFLYFLMENIALTKTNASNVGVIVALAPFFTVLFSKLFLKEKEPLQVQFFVGFLVAMIGVVLIGIHGLQLGLNIEGDLCALGAALCWGCYAVLTRKISEFQYSVILTTRRIFFYSLIWMLLAMPFFGVRFELERFMNENNLFNLFFLGLGASAMCYVTWSYAVSILGAIKTSAYIYAIPVLTVISAYFLLDEPITGISAMGTFLALTGLIIAQKVPLDRLFNLH